MCYTCVYCKHIIYLKERIFGAHLCPFICTREELMSFPSGFLLVLEGGIGIAAWM